MAALVQSYPQQTTVSMLQGRSDSSGSYSPSQQLSGSRSPQGPRYNPSSSSGSYRGLPSLGPVAPYAFTKTPPLSSTTAVSRQVHTPHLRSESRTLSAPVIPHGQHTARPSVARHRYPTPPSISTSSSSTASSQPQLSMDDTSISSNSGLAEAPTSPQPAFDYPSASLGHSDPLNPPTKSQPDRYRRNTRRENSDSGSDSGANRMHHRSEVPSGSVRASVGPFYNHPNQSGSSPSLPSPHSFQGSAADASAHSKTTSTDEANQARTHHELAKRYRRKSLGSLEIVGLNHDADSAEKPSPHPNNFLQTPGSQTSPRGWNHRNAHQRPVSHTHTASSDSISSSISGRSSRPHSARRDSGSMDGTSTSESVHAAPMFEQEIKHGNVPSRTTDSHTRPISPSPLSKPMVMTPEVSTFDARNVAQKPTQPSSASQKANVNSLAAQHLAAVSQHDATKTKSMLRRAFSFGSTSELRRSSVQPIQPKTTGTDPLIKRNSKYENGMGPEQARIAEKQEAGGLGESIYSGQGNFFIGNSNDAVSITSTASSASLMLRKMSKGVKKSTRSLVGLFRPKSVVGIPAADGPIAQGAVAEVSRITVEAERERVNVNVDPHDQPNGGTGFPKLEKNSVDTRESSEGLSNDPQSRRSIVGSEMERAEVLAAVKKGILKRTDSSQSTRSFRPLDQKIPDFHLPNIPHLNESPQSSAPSTPVDDHPPRSGHRRTGSISIEGLDPDDYFNSITRLPPSTIKGAPATPHGSRNISFSPRIQFHDTWPSGEYDRRGEIATCNRLTPMLAQQIKEELNTFKMEMEVHESSKVYTHFF